MDIARAISIGFPDCTKWSLNGDEYKGLVWEETETPKPTLKKLQTIWSDYVKDRTRKSLVTLCETKAAEMASSGFAYDFKGSGGVHFIGSTKSDMDGWAEVESIFSRARRLGDTGKTVKLETNSGSVVATSDDFDRLMQAMENFRQPILQASFRVLEKIAAGEITTEDGVLNASDWPK